ncbi:MAG: peptidylprolyl isomerase [Chlorobi bacterium]|nr:peptidylprolyl isomerase [Chlorobiota bacterium]
MKTLQNGLLLLFALGFIIVSCKKEEEETCDGVTSVNIGSDKTLTYGDSLIADAGNAGATYLWSTGETTQTITIDTVGTYWVRVEKCESSKSDTIHISMVYPTIKVETDFGDFRIWLYAQTFLHRQNFLGLTEEGFYDSLTFHRVVYDFVIQGGDPQGDGFGGPGYTLPAEIIPGLNHVYGAVGAARMSDAINPDRDSNGSQFYIVSDPNGEEDILDGKYSVFGFVFSGMDVIFEISQVEVDSLSHPLETVYMNKVTIEELSAQQLQDNFDFLIP